MDAVTLLWWLTGIYLVVLVIVIAVTGLSGAFYLWRISVSLRKIAEGLKDVERHTAPLASHLNAANEGLGAIARSLTSARDHLVATDTALATVTQAKPSEEVA